MDAITIKATFLFEFISHSNWVNKAPSWFKPYRYGHHTVCIDKNGDVCHIGEDFKIAKDNDLFPVKVYSLKRTAHQ